jgi:hypothetical protein
MNMFRNNLKYLLVAFLITSFFVASAQRDTTLSQEVEVIKAYNPSISDANKISDMPNIEDADHEKPNFNYSIFSQPIFTTFSVNTLKAATFSSEPGEDTGFGLVRAGVGNYNRPYAEIFFNNQNNRNTLFGLHGRHLSSHGNITLEGDDKVDAPFAENEAEIFVKHMFQNSVLSMNLGVDHQGFNYYGYPVESVPEILLEEDQDINYFGERQTFTKGAFNINLDNSTARSRDFVFDFDFLYHYFGSKTGQREHFGEFMADVRKPFNSGAGTLKAGATFVRADSVFNHNLAEIGKSQQIWLTAQPAYEVGGDVAKLKVGLKTWFVLDDDSDAKAKIAPNVRAEIAPVKEIINIFAGVDGNYINNHYSKIAYENPFVDPQHDIINTFEKLRFYGGFDGKFATKTNYKIAVDYSMITDQPFYYLFKYVYPDPNTVPSPSVADNDFDVLYDDLDLLKFNVEIFHAAFDKMNLLISGNYYVYKLDSEEEAWNMPDWDATFSLDYQISEQLNVSTDLFFTGQRKALLLETFGFNAEPLSYDDLMELSTTQKSVYNLPVVFDLNFNANYKITEQFSVFAQLSNFGFQKYQRWLGYPVQSFNVLGGLSYAF